MTTAPKANRINSQGLGQPPGSAANAMAHQPGRGKVDAINRSLEKHEERKFLAARPVRGPLNSAATDHVTDAYDTIDWLVKNTPESNGRVGMIV